MGNVIVFLLPEDGVGEGLPGFEVIRRRWFIWLVLHLSSTNFTIPMASCRVGGFKR